MNQPSQSAVLSQAEVDELRARIEVLRSAETETRRQREAAERVLYASTLVTVEFEVHTISEANARDFHHHKGNRVRHQREVTDAHLKATGRDPGAYRYPLVTLTRICRGNGLDDDNLRSALKAVRDEVARWLGLDDGPRSPVRWAYHQESTKSPLRSVRIEVIERGAP